VDYLPCSIYFNSNLQVSGFDCSRIDEAVTLALELGTDPFVGVGFSPLLSPTVTTSTRVETGPATDHPILWQTWDTPAGRLTQAIRKEGVCADWSQIHWGDESAGACCKPLIEGPEDVFKFEHLVQPPREGDYEALQQSWQTRLTLARSKKLPVVATYGQGLAWLMFMQGAEASVFLSLDHYDDFVRIAEIIHRREMRQLEWAVRAGADILKRFGGYEMCNFYNPDIFRAVCLPRLKKEVELAHSLGALIYYRVVTGMEPILDDIASVGFDCIEGGEPRLSRCSLRQWHDAFQDKAASWTGISTPGLLGGKSPDQVRAEVRLCAEIFGHTGFILGVTNSIRQHFPWENTLAMVDEWKKVRQPARSTISP